MNCIKLKSNLKFASYAEELKYLVTDRDRMAYVASLIGALAESGNTLVLVDRLEAGELLCEFLGIPKSEFVRGETKRKIVNLHMVKFAGLITKYSLQPMG
ncbi:UNVERIFIED_ORG: hypothetical protein [Escherichia phage CMSTMSU]